MGGEAALPQPPGPCPLRANSTRCSGVKSVNRRDGSGGRSIWPGLGGAGGATSARCSGVKSAGCPDASEGWSIRPGLGEPGGVSRLTLSEVLARQADQANHNPPAAHTAATARKRGFLFIVLRSPVEVSSPQSPRHRARILGSWHWVWNGGGKSWCESPPRRNEPEPRPHRRHAQHALGSTSLLHATPRETGPGRYRNSRIRRSSRIGRVVG